MTDSPQDEIGVLLLNLGGPEKVEDVRPFLFNLFSDRLIIRLGPAFMQKFIAWWIAKKRAPKSQGYYRQIGGGSPLNSITKSQGEALEDSLKDYGNFKVDMAMRYWRPFAEEILPKMKERGICKIVGLSLYPHYSIATTGSSLIDLKKKAAQSGHFEIIEVSSWPEQPDYIACLAARIQGALKEFESAEIVYSAHSLPVKFIEDGDPYVEHLKKSIKLIEEKTGQAGHLCYQSRSGPVEWLEPSTPETLEKLSGQGVKNIVMVPISFVSDHVETLCEIDIQYKELAESLGMTLVRTKSLNTDPHFITGLRKLVVSACKAQGWC